MVSEKNNKFLKQLLSLPGLSGNEGPVREIIAEAWKPYADELSVSPLGSLHALQRGAAQEPRPRILLAAHMDAIGLMVNSIVDGFIRVAKVGGVDPRILPGQEVIVHGREDISGVVAQPPDFLLPDMDSDKPAKLDHLLVDTGLLPEEVNEKVRPGDFISFAQQPVELEGGVVAGHSLDNRSSVVALTIALEELSRIQHDWDVWAVATVQEEITLGGAMTSPFSIRPDVAVAVDVTFAKGPGITDYRGQDLDKGPTIGWGANNHPALHKAIKGVADRFDIPYQVELIPVYSGTDAYAMEVVAEGIPCMVIGIPLRYMHTPVEVVSLKSISRVGHLLAQFIANLDSEFVSKITWEE